MATDMLRQIMRDYYKRSSRNRLKGNDDRKLSTTGSKDICISYAEN
jgi:hypothetical protein